MLKPGLYEQIISQSLSRELASVSDACKHVEKLDAAEAPQALAGYVAEAMRAALEAMPAGTEEQSVQRIALVNKVLDVLSQQREDLSEKSVDDRAEKLLQILQENDPSRITGMTAAKMPRPETPMAVSSLFTGAAHEPKMFTELQKEIASADRIDMLVSFVKWSGLRLIIDALQAFTARGGLLRVITTSYMGATEVKAIDELAALPNTEIKVSYDTARTRLHAKTYVFYRDTGFTTAYVGSSNLRVSQLLAGICFLGVVIFLVYDKIFREHKLENLYVNQVAAKKAAEAAEAAEVSGGFAEPVETAPEPTETEEAAPEAEDTAERQDEA